MEKKYSLNLRGEQVGPLTLEQLREIEGHLSNWFGAAHRKLERSLLEFRRPRAL